MTASRPALRERIEKLRSRLPRPAAPGIAWITGLFALWAAVALLFPKGLPAGVLAMGLVVGGLSGLTAVGLVIIFRSNRIINFPQAEFGTLAATLTVLLINNWHWSYYVAVASGLAVAVVSGMLVDLSLRRFFRAPRLILTVATIGV